MWTVLILALTLALGLALGAWLGALVRRPWFREPELVAVSGAGLPPAAHPELAGTGQLWILPDAGSREQVMLALADWLASAAPVVLAPLPEQRSSFEARFRGRPGLSWCSTPRPAPGQLLSCGRRLQPQGAVTLLVAGPRALEASAADEQPDDLVIELLEGRPPELGLLILALAGELPEIGPDLTLRLGDRGLVTESGAVFFHRQEEGLRVTPAAGS